MASKNTAVFGIYPSRTAAEEALGHLRSAGFRSTDTSALFPDNQGTKDLAHEKNTKAPEGAVLGAVVGVIVGGVLGWLIGSGTMYVSQLPMLTSAGPVVSAFAGLGAIGLLGGILGALIGLSFPEYEAKRFEGRIRDGGVLLSVHCDNHDWVKRAKDVMQHTGAQDIGAEGEKSGDFANGDKPLPRVRPVVEDPVVANDVVYTERPATRIRPTTVAPVAGGDEVYTERIVRRRTVQDPDDRE
jgi:hypothetical protein